MNFAWIKRYMPRSLYGRAVLILLLPIIALQLIVAQIFIQRHFDGVTRQLALGVSFEIQALTQVIDETGRLDAATLRFAKTLALNVRYEPDQVADTSFKRDWYDISGRMIKGIVERTLQRPVGVDLESNFRRVTFEVPADDGVLFVDTFRQRVSASNPHQLLLLMIFASLVLTAISLLFLRNQMRPIKRLAMAAEAFGKGRSDPFRPSGAEEVRRAGTAFLAMRGRIERQIDQRTRMLSGVSHDLRTPLTRMKLALATADDLDDLEALAHDVDEMEKMLEEFLSFARGDNEETSEIVDAVELVEQVVEDARRSGTDIAVVVLEDPGDAPQVGCRRTAIHRALQNLVGNAARYGSRVKVTTDIRGRSVNFSVEDNGPGIPAAERAEALKPFSRLDRARNQDLGSSVGLGLAIALDIARSHGGSLQLDESADLGGLKASLTIPR